MPKLAYTLIDIGNQGTSYANPDAVTGIGAVSVDYDNNGNVTNLHWGSYSLIGSSYDYNNRISATTRPNSQSQSYKYDHTGQRMEQNINSGSKVTVYPNKYYDVTTEGSTVTKTYQVYANGGLVGTVTNDGTNINLDYVHSDQIGSSSIMTTSDGSVDQAIDYYPYGGIRFNEQNSSFSEPKQFSGHFFDSDTTLQYFGARYYQGDVGRFWSQDTASRDNPVQFLDDPQQLNYYSYARNNPLILNDPSGNASVSTVFKSFFNSIASFFSGFFNKLNTVNQAQITTPKASQTPVQKTDNTPKSTTWDPVTDQRISQLDPKVQQPATNFINDTESKLNTQLRVVQGYRSIEEQDKLYEQGRTTPGNIVTNAKGGESYHNYGLAIDIVIMDKGQPNWNKPISQNIANIGINQGFSWGGSWTSIKDYPHFEMSSGKSISELKNSCNK